VYEKIDLFKGMKQYLDFQTPVRLEGNLPKNIMNLYINSMYTGHIDLNNIPSDHFIDFLKFIDQYPATSDGIEISYLEHSIVKCVQKHNLTKCEYLKSICKKYGLKLMLVIIHNSQWEQ
jgi:hypothetical protein